MGKTRADQRRRSKQPWERGRGAKRKGNPRYKPVVRNGRKVYILRKPMNKDKKEIYKIEWEDKEVFVNRETLMRILGNFGLDMEELQPKEIKKVPKDHELKGLDYFIYN